MGGGGGVWSREQFLHVAHLKYTVIVVVFTTTLLILTEIFPSIYTAKKWFSFSLLYW